MNSGKTDRQLVKLSIIYFLILLLNILMCINLCQSFIYHESYIFILQSQE